jgi:hypothetical protein
VKIPIRRGKNKACGSVVGKHACSQLQCHTHAEILSVVRVHKFVPVEQGMNLIADIRYRRLGSWILGKYTEIGTAVFDAVVVKRVVSRRVINAAVRVNIHIGW